MEKQQTSDMVRLRKIRAIAKRVRANIEQRRADLEALGHRFCWQNLCGLCGIASHALNEALRAEGFDSKVVFGRDKYCGRWDVTHAWVEVDGLVVDITATQFSTKSFKYPKIFISDRPADGLLKSRAKTFRYWLDEQKPSAESAKLLLDRYY